MKLVTSRFFVLCRVSKKPDGKGKYKALPFDLAPFDQDIDEDGLDEDGQDIDEDDLDDYSNPYSDIAEDDLDEALDNLVVALYGRGDWYKITDEKRNNKGEVYIINHGECITVPDIIDKIDIGREFGDSHFFVCVNAERSDYRWVTAEPQGMLYSG